MNFFNLLEVASDTASKSTVNPTANSGGFGWQTWVLYAVLIIGLIVMFVLNGRSRKKQQEELKQKYNSLAVGDTIKTIGMICGTIVELCEDGTIVLLTGSENYPSYIRVDRQAIYQFAKKQEQVDPFENLGENGESSQNTDNADKITDETPSNETQSENTENTQNTES